MSSSRTWFKIQLWFIVLAIIAGVWWMWFQWGECRDMGFSFWYCVQHIA